MHFGGKFVNCLVWTRPVIVHSFYFFVYFLILTDFFLFFLAFRLGSFICLFDSIVFQVQTLQVSYYEL